MTHPETLTFIQAYTTEHGYPPSLNEIAAHLNRGKTAAWRRLQDLQKEGLITMRPGGGVSSSRTILLTDAAMKELETNL